jgi:hypothetical protein
MSTRAQGPKSIPKRRYPPYLDHFFYLLDEYSALEKAGQSFVSKQYDDILSAKLAKYARQHNVSVPVFAVAIAEYYLWFSTNFSLQEPVSTSTDQAPRSWNEQSGKLLDLSVKALGRAAAIAEEAVFERRKCLREIARIEKRIDRTQLATSRLLKQLVAR